MTKQEIIEMLDSTITANGQRAISGQSLNAALHALLEYNEPADVNIVVDGELNETSLNPIANAAVSSAIKTLVEGIEAVAENTKDFLTIDLSLGGTNIRDAFSKHELQNKQNTPLPCYVKLNTFDTDYLLATMVVESFNSSGDSDGSDMYKISFVSFGVNSKIVKSKKDGKTTYFPMYAWSSDCFIGNSVVKSYIYTPSTNSVQCLGDGKVLNEALNEIVEEGRFSYDSLTFNKTYYVVKDSVLKQILVAVKNSNGTLSWYNTKDGLFELVKSYE